VAKYVDQFQKLNQVYLGQM